MMMPTPIPTGRTIWPLTYLDSDYVGVGGPNLAPAGDGSIADCVANAPGGPVHVLLSDTLAEHIPGCNMSFRKSALEAVGGFDPRYRAAGDDVDLCWRIQDQVGEIGFHAAAMVWHHRRNSMQMYWKQQQGYGKAEALLEEKWPEKYNALGHTSWGGRLYGKGLTWTWAHAGAYLSGCMGQCTVSVALPACCRHTAFAAAHARVVSADRLAGVLSLLSLGWAPLGWIVPVFLFALGLPVAQALLSAGKARFTSTANARTAPEVACPHRLHAPAAAFGAADRPATPRTDALASAHHCNAAVAVVL